MSTTFNCPRCGSENTQAAGMVVANGTSKGATNFVMLDGQNNVDFGIAGTMTQTELAAALDPGVKPSSGLLLVVIMVLVCIVAALSCIGAHSWVGWGTGTIAVLTLLSVFGYSRGRKRVRAWPERVARYLRQWVCLRCGVVWEQE
jgi:transcription elongation factor Elf1